jgi:hypothetical protein
MVSGLGPHVQYVNGPIWKTSAASVQSSFRLYWPEQEVECILSKTKTKKTKGTECTAHYGCSLAVMLSNLI